MAGDAGVLSVWIEVPPRWTSVRTGNHCEAGADPPQDKPKAGNLVWLVQSGPPVGRRHFHSCLASDLASNTWPIRIRTTFLEVPIPGLPCSPKAGGWQAWLLMLSFPTADRQ